MNGAQSVTMASQQSVQPQLVIHSDYVEDHFLTVEHILVSDNGGDNGDNGDPMKIWKNIGHCASGTSNFLDCPNEIASPSECDGHWEDVVLICS